MGGEEHYEQYAIASYNGHGPIFGGKDIVSPNNGKWTSIPRVYPNLNIPTSYEIDDYEVFQKHFYPMFTNEENSADVVVLLIFNFELGCAAIEINSMNW
ncbi:8522_t:CDS:2 [Funneliformis geosporum]|uniref:8522_t:CDS:1 n=1 Tax=Funneliformis geosporum TaxID=1117311 RepID=A0A9W4SAQ5_9GLOM|nr:8522_t:CDS:2 [Funneliformis geosporum]